MKKIRGAFKALDVLFFPQGFLTRLPYEIVYDHLDYCTDRSHLSFLSVHYTKSGECWVNYSVSRQADTLRSAQRDHVDKLT